MRDAQPQVIMVPRKVAQAMDWPEPAADIVPFLPHEIIHKRQ
jgi:hypothetical protein